MRLPFQDGFQSGAQRKRRFPCAGPPAERNDADVRVEQQVQGHPLLGRAPMDAECFAVPADETDLLVRGDAGQRRAALGVQHQTGVAGQLGGIEQRRVVGDRQPLAAVESIDRGGSHGQLGHARPAGIDRS